MVRTKMPAAINSTSGKVADRGAGVAFQHHGKITSRGMHRWRQSKRDACDQRQGQYKQDGIGVQAQVQDHRDMALGQEVNEDATSPVADRDGQPSG